MTAKKMSSLIISLCLIFLLSACGHVAVPEAPKEGASGAQQEEVPDTAEDPAKVPEPEPDLFLNAVPSEKCRTLTELADPFGEFGAADEIYALGGNLLTVAVSTPEDLLSLSLKLISSETGLLLSEAKLTCGGYYYMFPAEKHFLIIDYESQTATVFDDRLVSKEYLLGEGADRRTFFMDRDAKYLYSAEYPCENITVTELETGEEKKITPNLTDIELCCPGCESTLIRGKDRETGETRYFSLEMAAGEFTQLPYEGDYVPVAGTGDLRLAQVERAMNTFRIDSRDGAFIFSADADSSYVCAGNGLILLRRVDETYDSDSIVYSAYRRDGTFVSSCSFNMSCSISPVPVYCPQYDGFFFLTREITWQIQDDDIDYTIRDDLVDIATIQYGTGTLQYWNCAVPAEGMDLKLHPLSEYLPAPGSEDAVAAVLYERAEKLGERYGFELLIADRAERDFDSFLAEAAEDYWSIDQGLNKLEKALGNYPDGFFNLLPHDTIRGFRIHFTGTITPKSEEYDGNSWGAFVRYTGEYQTMIVDLSGWSLENTFCHEFSHLIDAKLGYDSLMREDALYSDEGWDALNPPDFEYSYSYADVGSYDNRYYSYFVDSYSQTFPTEDRARIMEYAINEPWMFCDAERLLSKLYYYSRCIRDALDPGDWPEVLSWEKPLYDYGYRQLGQ